MEEVLQREQRAETGDRLRIANILVAIADIYRDGGRLPEAARSIDAAIQMRRRLGSIDTWRFAEAVESEGLVRFAQGQFSVARETLIHSLKMKERLLGKDYATYAQTLANLGVLYTETGYYSRAERFHSRAQRIIEQAGTL